MSYIELHACSAFSFLRGASLPEQLAERAAELELPAVALLDRNGVYGAQRFSVACREHGVRPIVGANLTMEDGSLLPVLVENRAGPRHREHRGGKAVGAYSADRDPARRDLRQGRPAPRRLARGSDGWL